MKGGSGKGQGRPKGVKNKKTLEQKAIADAFSQRIFAHADSLFHAQLTLALGSVRVFRVDEVEDGKNKKRIHTLIEDVDKIKKVLDETDGSGGATIEDDYYFVQQVPPDNKAIDSLLNRGLGKPTEKHEHTGADGGAIEHKHGTLEEWNAEADKKLQEIQKQSDNRQ